MKWHFKPFPPGMVETDVTQGDQFRNDDVDLADSLGRESTQNSLDAALPANGAVRIRFSFLENENAPDVEFLRSLFDGHDSHAAAAGIDLSSVKFDSPKALVIEDFGTKGLTGRVDEKDDENFSDFWRRHGRSHKSGKSLGRWGLGKLVFSMSSQLKSFFGLTVQHGSNVRALMGQSVLGMHRIGKTEYAAHTFFSDLQALGTPDELPVPVADNVFVNEFASQFRLTRTNESGLSVVIPFPSPDLSLESMTAVTIVNYFIPILRRQLVLEFDGTRIDHDNILQYAQEHALGKIKDIDYVFRFVSEASTCTNFIKPSDKEWFRNGALEEGEFSPEDLAAMRERFSSGELVAVELPIRIQRVGGPDRNTTFRLFLKKPEGIQRGQDFYVRGGITLPQEAKFHDRKALGMLIADDDVIAEFLGDAENAAHTKWNGKAEKLQKYRSPGMRLKAVRNSLVELHDHLVQAIEEENERALLEFFWTPGDGNSPKAKSSPIKKTPHQNPPPPPEPNAVRIGECEGGLSILPGRKLNPEELPMNAVIRMAYDVSHGNPFRLYSPADFDLGNEEEIQIEATGDVIVEAARNELRCRLTGPEFDVRLTGFDDKRDLIVTADSLEAPNAP